VACDAASRFSNLGILAVGVLLISGTINASFLIVACRASSTHAMANCYSSNDVVAAMVCLAGSTGSFAQRFAPGRTI